MFAGIPRRSGLACGGGYCRMITSCLAAARLSTDDPYVCLDCPSGGVDYGYMPAGLGASVAGQPEPIRLQRGYAGPHGFGYLHVRHYEPRLRQMATLGFPSFEDFAYQVARGYDSIYQGKVRGRRQRACHVPGYSFYVRLSRAADLQPCPCPASRSSVAKGLDAYEAS